MADNQTNWIFNLVDRITGPMKKITSSTNVMEEAIEDVNAIVKLNASDTKQALETEKKHRSELIQKIKDQEKVVESLEDAMSGVAPGKMLAQAKADFDKATARLEDYRKALKGAEADIEDLEDAQQQFLSHKSGWESSIIAINQFAELAEKAVNALDFAGEINDLRTDLQRMTGEAGEGLDELTARVHRLSKVYHEDGAEIAVAANALSKQMQIPIREAFDLIEKGFQKGANLNGELLDQTKEYGAQLEQVGLSGSQAIALMAHAGRNGIFSDKAIDAIKEANLSLREMGQPQIDALKGIGLEVKDLAGKTAFEAAQMVAKAMQKAPVQARQMALTDIFKGAGEDAGLAFIMGLGDVDMDIDKIPSIQQAGEGLNGFLADLESSIANTFGNATTYVQSFAMGAVGITSTIEIFKALNQVTWIQNAATKAAAGAQWLLNAAFKSSPIGWITLAITGLVAGFTLGWNHSERFRKVIFGLWETFKQVFTNIAGLFKAVFSPIGEAVTAINEGRYLDAAKAAVKMNPASMAIAAAQYAANGGLTKGVGEAWERGNKKGAESWEKSQQGKSAKEDDSLLSRAFSKKKGPTLDGILAPDDKKGKKKGLEINGSGGGKAITMNLKMENHFNQVSSEVDFPAIVEKIIVPITDRLRDAAINL